MDLVEVANALRESPADSGALLESALSALARATPLESAPPVGFTEVVARLLEDGGDVRDRPIFAALLREAGLFPYLSQADPSDVFDQIAIEAHTAASHIGGRKLVMHRDQATAFLYADAGHDLALSAPTSFGKTAIAHQLIRTNKHANILVAVPTLALLDETRRSLANCGEHYKIVTHPDQVPADRNLMILTPERALEMLPNCVFDLVVIDEFYTLDDARRRRLENAHDERSTTLNALYSRVAATDAQVVMLGPSISGLAPDVSPRLRRSFVRSESPTVHLELNRLDDPGERKRPARAAELVESLSDPTLVYASGPARSETVARAVVASRSRPERLDQSVDDAVAWIRENYGGGWVVADALAAGVGLHHGALSRGIARFMVRAFNDGRLSCLVCTSTLLQGVNTAAKNVVVVDQKLGTGEFDSFAFANIAGRAGRMGRYFVGRVYHFGVPPADSGRIIDVPVVSQGPDTPDELVVEVLREDPVSDDERQALIREELDAAQLSIETVRTNIGVPLPQQLALARRVRELNDGQLREFAWTTATPNTSQLTAITNLLWDSFSSAPTEDFFAIKPFISSVGQLRLRLKQLQQFGPGRGFYAAVFADQRAYAATKKRKEPDFGATIRDVNRFMRDICGYRIPSRLRAVESVLRPVLQEHGIPAADYRGYASTIENLYMGVAVAALDELGIPPQLIAKISPQLRGAQTADASYGVLRGLETGALSLTPFEREILDEAIGGLGGGQTTMNI